MNKLKEEFIEYLQKKELSLKANGSSRDCLIHKVKPVVYLRNIKPMSFDSMQQFQLQTQKKVYYSKKFLKSNISVAPVFGGFSFDKHFIEVQKQATGVPIGINNFYHSYKQMLTSDDVKILNTMNNKEAKKYIIEKIKAYNLNIRKKLASAPQQHFDKFIGDQLKLKKLFNIDFVDCHSGNVFYDENNGFTIIDLDIDQNNLFENEYDIFSNILYVLNDVLEISKDEKYIKDIKQHNSSIFLKLLIAAKRNKIDFTPIEIEGLKDFTVENMPQNKTNMILKKIDALNLIFGRQKK